MKVLVPIKRIASLDDDFELRGDGCDVDPDFCEYDLNEFDEYSIEAAVRIKESRPEGNVEVVVLTVGPDTADDVLRKGLAKGGDRAVRVWDEALKDSDQMAIARVIAKVVEREKPRLVLCGAQSSDHGHASTGIAVAGFLGWPHAAVVCDLDFRADDDSALLGREVEGGVVQRLTIETPAVLTIQLGANKPRYASLRSIKQANARPLEVLLVREIGLDEAKVGRAGSASYVRRVYAPSRGGGEMIEGTPAQQAARLIEIVTEVQG